MDAATKTVKNFVMNTAKTASKWVALKIAETTIDLIENKIADKITSVAKSKNNAMEPQ